MKKEVGSFMFLKNKKTDLKVIFSLIGIILLGLLLRLIGLNKPDGFWYDEVIIYYESIQPFPFGILEVVGPNVPLYQFLLHFWINIFGNGDIILRFSSVIIGILTIIVGYFCGKELDSKKTGLLVASLISFNSFFIYYSQEVKYYMFLAFLTTLATLFLLKVNNKHSKFNYLGLILSNLAIIYTYTIGFVFVFWELFLYFIYLFIRKKDQIKRFLYYHLVFLLLCIPFLIKSFDIATTYTSRAIGGWDAFYWDLSIIPIILQDWFTPVLVGIHNIPANYFNQTFDSSNIIFKVVFLLVPAIIYLIGITSGIKKKNYSIIILLTALLFVITELITSVFTSFKCMARYTILSLPLIIIFTSYGLSSLKSKFLKHTLITTILVLNFYYLIVYPNSAPKLSRPEGHKLPGIILSKYDFNEKDYFITPTRTYLFDKYYSINGSKINLQKTFLKPENNLNLLIGEESANKINKDNNYDIFKDYLKNKLYSKDLENYVVQNIFNHIEQDRYFVIIINKNFLIDPSYLDKIVLNDKYYYKTPLFNMLMTKTTNHLVNISFQHLKLVETQQKGSWLVCIFKK